jgi:hypothetical protein
MLLLNPRSAADTIAVVVLRYGALLGHCVWFLYYSARSQLHCLFGSNNSGKVSCMGVCFGRED